MKKYNNKRSSGLRFSLIALLALQFFMSTSAQTATLRINEFLALNQSGLTDEDGDFSDWIEIYNPTSQPVNLQGWSITDDATTPTKWLFPDITIEADGYMVVYASGKDRAKTTANLHTNFKLSGSGEYLALYNAGGVAASSFSPTFPAQSNNVSYGFYEGGYMSFTFPTPGLSNSTSATIQLPAPTLSAKHGFFDAAFNLSVTSAIANAKIYYTTDGSVPSSSNGTLYQTPISVSKSTIFRAVAEMQGAVTSKVSTQTYLFTNDIVNQPNNPVGYPSLWGPYSTIPGTAIADYEMDPEIIAQAGMAERVKAGLKDIPTISLVTDKNHFFNRVDDPVTGGIYIYTGPPTGGSGLGWERPVSFEYFDAKDVESLQIDCEMELHGWHSRVPEKNPKHSIRLSFKDEYGPSKLKYPFFGNGATDSYNTLVFRSNFGNTWLHWSSGQRARGTLTQDFWAKVTQKEIGQLACHENQSHLYINGIYWGIYTPSEKPDSDFGESYLGGNVEDYDVIKDYTEVADGNSDAWNAMFTLARLGLTDNTNYQQIQGNNPDGTPNPSYPPYLDMENLADYMLINMFAGNSDWDHHNWVALRNRVNPGKGFKFICWDSECILESVNSNVLAEKNNNCPSELFQLAVKNEDFKRLLANRAQKHLLDGGALSPSSNIARWGKLAKLIDKAIDAESARWGDYRRDVHPYSSTPYELYTRDNQYMTEQNYLTGTYFPQRTNIFIEQLKTAGLFPSVAAPVLKVNNVAFNGGNVVRNASLTITAAKGTIYYTTDGSDPVVWSGSTGTVSATAKSYSSAITVAKSMRVKARAYYNSAWSAMNDKFLTVTDDYKDLKITEVHYHPSADETGDTNDYEFLEIKNTGAGYLNIGGISIAEGVTFTFPMETELKPGGFIVLASKVGDFKSRYSFSPFDDFSGNLDNDGEYIKLLAPDNTQIGYFRFNDGIDWPQTPDGLGNSLVPTELNPTNDQNSALYWRASYEIGGSPGRDDVPTTTIIENISQTNVVLSQNYPNPVDDLTYIDFQIQQPSQIKIEVFNAIGVAIDVIVEGNYNEGLHQVSWSGANRSPGVYFYRLTAKGPNGTVVITKKMMKK